MKIRIASSIALAAALALGATGCSLVAPVGTNVPYAPSDGVDVTIEGIDVRNIMLIADESGENFNVVFTAVNLTGDEQTIAMTFVSEDQKTASAEFTIPTGSTVFGNPAGDKAPVLITVPGLKAGATITTYFQLPGAAEAEHMVPVLDGTLEEYKAYVIPTATAADDVTPAEKELTAEDDKASQPKVGDDEKEAAN